MTADGRTFSWSIREIVEVDSTQTAASRLGAGGASEGTVVVAERQTAGRGRHQRRWASPKGGLYMSMILRPPPGPRVETLTLLAAAAVVRGTADSCGIRAQIRWPNDIMIKGKKVGGVIAESDYSGSSLSFVVVGVGVNCNPKPSSAELGGEKATSLSEEAGRNVEIAKVRQAILGAFGKLYSEWLAGSEAIELARGMLGTLGKNVSATTVSGKRIRGAAVDVEPTGGLVIKVDGKKFTLHSQDVELLREE